VHAAIVFKCQTIDVHVLRIVAMGFTPDRTSHTGVIRHWQYINFLFGADTEAV